MQHVCFRGYGHAQRHHVLLGRATLDFQPGSGEVLTQVQAKRAREAAGFKHVVVLDVVLLLKASYALEDLVVVLFWAKGNAVEDPFNGVLRNFTPVEARDAIQGGKVVVLLDALGVHAGCGGSEVVEKRVGVLSELALSSFLAGSFSAWDQRCGMVF